MNIKLNKYISSYEVFARYLPAILTSLPFLILGYFLLRSQDTGDIITFLLSLNFVGYLSFSFVGLYFFAQLIRTTSKYFEKKYFHDQNGFPTTYFMLYANAEYSDAFKDAYREQVAKEMGFALLSRDEEVVDPLEGKRRLNDVTKRIILKVGDGVLVGKHNQWYGFFRNLIGGAIFAMIGCVLNTFLGFYALHHRGLVYLSILLFVAFGTLLLFRRQLIVQNAEAYAKQLHAEFMTARQRVRKKTIADGK